MTRRVVIVGGGISGLATAWQIHRLAPNATEILVLESSPHVGGTARTIEQDGYLLETGPNGFLDSRTPALDLCKQLGLESELLRAAPSARNRYVFLGDHLRPIPLSPWEFLKSDLLSFPGKLRVLAERFIPARKNDADETIFDFGTRRIGRQATEVLLDAFVTGILAGDTRLLSLPASFPRMREMELQYGGLFRAMSALARQRRRAHQQSPASAGVGSPTGTLTTLRGGMGRLMQRMAELLKTSVRINSTVTQVHRRSGGCWQISVQGGDPIEADSLVLACPSSVQSRLLSSVDSNLSAELGAIPYAPAVVAMLGYPASAAGKVADGFGYLAPYRLGRSVLGVIFSSSIFPEQAPPGKVAFRAILGGWNRGEVIQWSDQQIIQTVRDDLRVSLGVDANPEMTWICRWPNALPQYHLGHRERIARIDAACQKCPGLHLTGNALRGVALYECADDAERTARKVIEERR
jgi:oxygen-dependent protoporphyrinogen oxidase